jgi:hypothetical protein
VEISILVLGVLFERLRPDLRVRRWWSRHGWQGGRRTGLSVPVPVALAGLDARRLLLRPTSLFLGFVLGTYVSKPAPLSAYSGVNRTLGLAWAVLGVLVMVLVASTAGRDRREEILAATPKAERSPLTSWIVLLALGAAGAYGLAAVLRYGHAAPASYAELLPSAWDLAQVPLMLFGGGLLGLIGARLLPGWVAAPLLAVLAIAWVGVASNDVPDGTMLAPVVEWVQYHEDGRVMVEPGSFGWHNAYLAGLCGLGVVAALLTLPGRRRVLLPAGAVLAVGTVLAGALAMP